MASFRNEAVRIGLALAIGAVGAGLAVLIGLPAPYLTGPAITVTCAGLAGLKLDIPKLVAGFCFVVIGMSIGTGVTPEVLTTARQWPASFVMLAFCLFAIMSISGYVLRRGYGYDRVSALLASSPGHLSYVLGLSANTGADIRLVSLVQSIRLLAMTLLVPFAIASMGPAIEVEILPLVPMTVLAMALTFVASVAIGFGLERLHVPAGLLLGGMLVSSATHMSGMVAGAVPDWLMIPTFMIMGSLIGTRFSGVTLALLRSAVGAGIAMTLISSGLSALFAGAVALLFDLPLAQLLMAFMPGGVEVMIAMAVMLDADPTFVAAHHVMRLFILTFMVPLMLPRKPKT